MPIYEYACRKCGKQFEYMQRMSDPPKRKCEACGGQTLERQISQTSFQLKGSGWYKDLYSSPKPAAAGKSEGAASDAGASSDSGSGSSGSADAGSAAGAAATPSADSPGKASKDGKDGKDGGKAAKKARKGSR